jgi:hypothetical protein
LRPQNVTDWVDVYPVHVKCCEASILFRPRVTVISGSKHPTSLTRDGMCSGEDVIVATINSQCRNVGRCQPMLASVQVSSLSVERYTPVPHPAVTATIIPTGLIARDQMLPRTPNRCYRGPPVAIVCRSENSAPKNMSLQKCGQSDWSLTLEDRFGSCRD